MDDATIVRVKQGTLRGFLHQSIYGTLYVAFQAIPYAAPPIGNLRFMDPHRPVSWKGIRECLPYKGNCCVQKVNWPYRKIIGAEDCLYLNIYVPLRIRKSTGIAVMVWIHGGHYISGNGNFKNAQPDYLMEKDIILVTVNYRLGVFGFLNLNHKLVSGNQGLKDQVAALVWINENIAAFGGDPNNITLFGSNVGAICVHLLMISPLSKDLFHKAILQSGVASMDWTIEDNDTINHSYTLATAINKNSSAFEDVILSLRTASTFDIIKAQYDILTTRARPELGGLLLGPSIDICAEKPFLPCSPRELLHNGNQKPVILGHTSLEFMRFLEDCSLYKLQILYNIIPQHMKGFLPKNAPEEHIETLGMSVQQYYFSSIPPKRLSCLWIVLECYSNICFNIPIKKIADERRKFAVAPTYLYEFSYVGNHKIIDHNAYFYVINLSASTQNDDVPYLFFLPHYQHVNSIFPPPPETDDFKMIQIMTSMWTNFAQTGDPTPFTNKYIPIQWKPATIENFYYLDINKELRLLSVRNYDHPLRR